MKWTYLLINLLTIGVPLALSFDKKVNFSSRWRYNLPAIGITAIFFILWDAWFTAAGVWSFNPKYITGIHVLGLPLEEVLFFITVPYAVLFIYDCLRYYLPRLSRLQALRPLIPVLGFGLLLVAVFHFSRLYTSVNFLLAGLFILGYWTFVSRKVPQHLVLTYVIHLLPFFLVNGLLTSLPVVLYNPAEHLGLRLGTVPVEDAVYSLLLLMMNVSLYRLFEQGASFSLKPRTIRPS